VSVAESDERLRAPALLDVEVVEDDVPRPRASRSLLQSSENSARRGRAGPAAEEAPLRTPFHREHGSRSSSPGRAEP